MAFMGLGLIVGVTALGVITARAVVERRQQIGVLRAVGFRRRMVQWSFLLESSFIALTSIVIGTVLGLAVAFNVIHDTQQQPAERRLPPRPRTLGARVRFGDMHTTHPDALFAPGHRTPACMNGV